MINLIRNTKITDLKFWNINVLDKEWALSRKKEIIVLNYVFIMHLFSLLIREAECFIFRNSLSHIKKDAVLFVFKILALTIYFILNTLYIRKNILLVYTIQFQTLIMSSF
jgi:hypothetical protein